jgi:flagellar basal-body rod modification protein FlgD
MIPIGSDLETIFNKPAAPKRKITTDVVGGATDLEEGDKKIFSTEGKKLGKQDFLQLLVTQMRFQDPLEPQENTEFVAQLAQFSSLEGTQNINESIEALSKKMEAMVAIHQVSSSTMSNASATSLIGRIARVKAENIVFDPSKKEPIKVNVHAEPGLPSVLSITDAKGNIVNAIKLDHAGESALEWNGLKMDGEQAAAGAYTLMVTTADGKDSGYAYLEARVNGITYAKDGVRLQIRGQEIAMDQVVQVAEPPVAAATGDGKSEEQK